MAMSYTNINTTPEDLGDSNFLYVKAYEIANRGTLVQSYIKKPFTVQVPLNTNPPTFKYQQLSPIVLEKSFFVEGLEVADLTTLAVGGTVPWTVLLTETLSSGQRRVTRAATVTNKGSLIHIYVETDYQQNNKQKLGISPEKFYWVSGVQISGTDLVYGTSAGSHDYGEIYVLGNSTATVLAMSTWAKFLGFTQEGLSNGMTPSASSDYITVEKDGKYMVTVSAGLYGGASATYELQVQKNGGSAGFSNVHSEKKLNASGDISPLSLSGIIEFSSSDTIELWVRQTAGTLANVTIKNATLSAVEVSR